MSALVAVTEWSFEAIGTHWWIGLYEPLSNQEKKNVRSAIAARIEQFDVVYSRFRSDSLVTRISQQAGSYDLPDDSVRLMTVYRQLYEATSGGVTPLIGQTLADAGYDAQYSLQPHRSLSSPQSWESALRFSEGKLDVDSPVLLDFGAAGKGYLVDIVAKLLERYGVTRYCIDASGDMAFKHTSESLRVGLEHPRHAGQVIGVADLHNQALCGSAGNRRAWKGYNHIMNPFTRTSPTDIAAVWVVADETIIADGLTTALYFVPPEQLTKTFSFEYVVMRADDSVDVSPGFPGALFTKESM